MFDSKENRVKKQVYSLKNIYINRFETKSIDQFIHNPITRSITINFYSIP